MLDPGQLTDDNWILCQNYTRSLHHKASEKKYRCPVYYLERKETMIPTRLVTTKKTFIPLKEDGFFFMNRFVFSNEAYTPFVM